MPTLAALLLTAALHAQVALPLLTPQPAAAPSTVVPDPTALKWDADSKDANPKPGDASVPYNFLVTNVSDHDVMLNKLRTSCGCTASDASGKLRPVRPPWPERDLGSDPFLSPTRQVPATSQNHP